MTCRVKRGIGALFIILGALGFSVGPTWAGTLCGPACTVRIDDLTDTVTVTGFLPTGATFPITLLPDSTGEFVHFNLSSLPAPSNSFSISRDLLEADGQTVSDRLLVSITAGIPALDVKFASDPASLVVPPGSMVLNSLIEDGTFQTLFTVSASSVGDSFIFQVRSDVGDRTDVPGPATILLLLASGTAGLGRIAWRRRR